MKFFKSIRVQLVAIMLLCYLTPTLILGEYMGNVFFADMRTKTETALTSSVEHAAEVNFAPANFIITPTEKNTPAGIQWARELAEVLGFKHICTLTVQEHDRMIGYVSQLCHAIAVSLMCANDNSSLCEYTGDSFRDLTRIARINDKMWAELFLWNKQNLISEIDQFDSALQEMRAALVADDRDKLEQMFRLSTQRRAAFDKKLPE